MVDQNPLSHPTQTLNTSMTVALNPLQMTKNPVSPHSNTQHKHDCDAEYPSDGRPESLSHPTQTLNTSMTVALNPL
ncbi:hypothetical protein RRG08_004083 [Elysia crispata]|uniref:Uncharacterized protein n=1 Tax=Elysia crispata TaxID=231223 RepID=A0AAE0XUY9_9GAST|nr:hypothetical protein RRG08_004083 [Elysia crispata]